MQHKSRALGRTTQVWDELEWLRNLRPAKGSLHFTRRGADHVT